MNTKLNSDDRDALLQRIDDLENELNETRGSLAFKLGHLIRTTVFSPVPNILLFPFKIIGIVHEYLIGRGRQNRKDGRTPHLRNNTEIVQPGQDAFIFKYFEEINPSIMTNVKSFRIASIASPKLNYCLSFDATVIQLRAENWQQQIQTEKPDVVLVQSSFHIDESWLLKIEAKSHCSQILEKLYQFCRAENIPVVFWDTEDKTHFPIFSKWASFFDHIFTVDPESLAEYNSRLGLEVELLPPAVQPAIHNPVIYKRDNKYSFSILYDGWADILEKPNQFLFLRKLFSYGLNIVESRYILNSNKLNESSEFTDKILGCIAYKRLLTALRHYRIQIMPIHTLSSKSKRAWQIIESISCGCSVIIMGSENQLLPCKLNIYVNSEEALIDRSRELLLDEVSRLKEVQKVRRELYDKHTYAHRIKQVCDSLGIPYGQDQNPMISIITPTKRPENLKNCIHNYTRQFYPNKELIIVINTNEDLSQDVASMCKRYTNVTVHILHQENNIGVCLNYGISNAAGKYWFKMDDDDYYGQNYITDMMHLCQTADAEYFGKPTGFIYLEKEEKLYLLNNAIESQFIYGPQHIPHLCGATLAGAKANLLPFSKSRRSSVDTEFKKLIKRMKYRILTGDIWNFVAFRSEDKGKHTWREGDSYLKKNAVNSTTNRYIDDVMI